MEIKALYRSPEQYADQKVSIQGWIRQSRFTKNVGFLMVNDGSFFLPAQCVISSDLNGFGDASHFPVASSVSVEGVVVLTPQAKQPFEVQITSIALLGECSADYPLQNKRQTFEFLRQYPTLRVRTNTFQAVFRVRSEISYAIHDFFHKRNFVYVHTPVITASDAEGAGEMFRVTTLDLADVPKQEDGAVDYTQDYFGKDAKLTVSGQLEVEPFIMSHRNVYTFGPTFRAEHSNTTRHAAEFWMIEPEIAFADLNDVMDLAEDMIKYIISHVLETLPEEMDFFNTWIDKGLLERLNHVRSSRFERMTYTRAIEILEKVNDRFEFPVSWGCDLQSEHERYLTEEVVKGPLFVTDYPKEIKAFYMRLNDDKKTVAACDMLVPGIGELVGGSQREERLDVLETMMREKNMELEDYQFYLNLRRFGGCLHGGYGLGFERCVMYLTGMSNIRDVLPYPRTFRSMRQSD
ncbi:MAG: asparagine--tRNA ligase [Peptoniphilaceae bacterium]|nr:asparagine--tRNA ligase [Peptoniphilaceae bacterium]MDY4196906.1 asparagine--tRNA ligase [Peptoniphilaceae bacterium]MDY5841700.1 asparagine--tRNA ligase [Peptoniphilaceae bacterium]MDY6146143.1 asparagine--tRNA ligase [Peptoniphilaceae bacterium]